MFTVNVQYTIHIHILKNPGHLACQPISWAAGNVDHRRCWQAIPLLAGSHAEVSYLGCISTVQLCHGNSCLGL